MFAFLNKLVACGPLFGETGEQQEESVITKVPVLPTNEMELPPNVGITCTNCGWDRIQPEHKFCSHCGTKVIKKIEIEDVKVVKVEGALTPNTSMATALVESAVEGALGEVLSEETAEEADDLSAPRSEYKEYWAPKSFTGSALATKAEFEASLKLPWGERCMKERAARLAAVTRI